MSEFVRRFDAAEARHGDVEHDGSMKYYVPPKEVLVAGTGIQGVMA